MIVARHCMKYDRPDYHRSNEFPEDISEDNAMTHMGFFFTWSLSGDLASDFHREEEDSAKPLELMEKRRMLPRGYVV